MGLKIIFNFAILYWMAMIVICDGEPCDYFDTVNITNAHKFENGSYLYDGVLLEPHEVAEYEYVMKYKNVIEGAPKHLRGCVCLKRPCIFFCCPWKQKFNQDTESCEPDSTIDFEPIAKIAIGNNTELRNVKDVFTVQVMTMSKKLDVFPIFPFTIWKNGTLKIDIMPAHYEKNSYCLLAIGKKKLLTLAIESQDISAFLLFRKIIYWLEIISIPFMILTICVYFYIGEVRNNYTKAFICYLVGLIIGYSCLSMFPSILTYHLCCKFSGYTAYYFFLMAFCALSVISYDIWHNFRGTRRYEDDKKFSVYALFIFGTPLICLIITMLAQEFEVVPDNYKPGIGPEHGCWINNQERLPAFIYFFGLMLIVIITNLIFFVLTARKLYHYRERFVDTTTTRSHTIKHLKNERARYGLFLRLFFLMGIVWIFTLASFFGGHSVTMEWIMSISSVLSATHGIIVFVLFVLRKPVRRALLKKLFKNEIAADSDSEGSYTLTSADPNARELLKRETAS